MTLAFLSISVVFAAPAGQITQTTGSVEISSPQKAPKAAARGEPVEGGETVALGDDSSVVIKFQDGQVIALKSKSIFKINSYKCDQAAP